MTVPQPPPPAPPPPVPSAPRPRPAPGDIVHWWRQLTKGRRTVEQDGYAIVCEVGRADASLYPISGPVTRRFSCPLDDLDVLVTSVELIAELDQCMRAPR